MLTSREREMSRTEGYLRDVIPLLIERGLEAKTRRDRAKAVNGNDHAFEKGRALAYYEVVSTLIGQLSAFGIEPESVGLRKDFDPDRELT